MSKSKDFKERQQLQAKFQAYFSQTSSRVLNWFGEQTKQNYESKDLLDSKTAFMQLPVIKTGSGLDFDNINNSKDSADIRTIGEFMNSNKKVGTLAKKKQLSRVTQSSDSIYKIQKNDDKAIISLKNKFKQQKRSKLVQKIFKSEDPINTARSKNFTIYNKLENSDSDDEPKPQTGHKKKMNILFSSSKKKK